VPTADSLVRALGALAVLATIPLWAPPDHVTSSTGVFMVATPAPAGIATVRVVSLGVVVALVLATVLVTRRSGRSAARRLAVLFAVPALALSVVCWRTAGGAGYTVAMVGAMGQEPPHAFASPWMPVAVAQGVLVVVLWALTLLGAAATVGRRPGADARPPSSGR
jgi:protein-S-isoprenylcysteine O-methyltransferase Ste14